MTENKLLTVSGSPHVKASDTTRTIMIDVLIALLPAMIWAVYAFGWRSLTLTLITVCSCMIFEFLFQKLRKKPITVSDCSAAVTGVLLAFSLPVNVPLWIPVIGAFFAIIIVKQLFGGIGKNVVNPAVSARVFLFISFPGQLTSYVKPVTTKLSAFSISGGDIADVKAGATVLPVLKAGDKPAYSILDALLGNLPGCLGEVSAVLLILGGLYLLLRRVITWHIPAAYIGTVAVVTYLFPMNHSVQPYEYMLYSLLSGGLIIAAFFMATDYVTCPITTKGKLIYGVGCGAITVFIRYFGGFPEGVSFAIMIMNLLVWYIDKFTRPKPFGSLPEKKPADGEQ